MKHFILAIVSISLCILIVACGGAPEIYRIGAVIPLTGSSAGYGRNVKNGLTLAMDQINEKGGINQRKIDILIEDDASNAKTAVDKTNELIRNGIRLIIGGVTSDVALAMAPICEKGKVVLLSPTASSPKLSSAGQYFFRNYPSDTLEGKVMAEYAVRRMKLQNVAILGVDNEYGKGIADVFKQRFIDLYGAVLYETYYPEGTQDFSAYVKEIKAIAPNPPDAIYLPGYYSEIAQILKELKTQEVKSKVISVEGAAQPMLLEIAGDSAEGLIYPQPPYDAESSDMETRNFVSAYKAKFPTAPDIDVAFAYDALRVVAKALETSTNYPDDIRNRIADTSLHGITGNIVFDSNGDVNIQPKMFQIIAGKFTPIP